MLVVYTLNFFLANQIKKSNPRELNPYLKDNGSGYPEDTDGANAGGDHLISSTVIGDGGASWRLKALKRAKEQAAREGRKLDDVWYLSFLLLFFYSSLIKYAYVIHYKFTGG